MTIKTYELSITNPTTESFEVDGQCEVMIIGHSPCTILRSIKDSGFFPITDEDGSEIFYPATNSSNIIFNGPIKSSSRHCKYKVALDKSGMSANSDVTVIVAQG